MQHVGQVQRAENLQVFWVGAWCSPALRDELLGVANLAIELFQAKLPSDDADRACR